MAYDTHGNFAYGTVLTAPSPATTGTTVVLNSGQGASFPDPSVNPFNVVIWPANVNPTPATAEIARVTGISGDTLTFSRHQEGTSARTVVVGDQVALAVTAKLLTDIENATLQAANNLSEVNAATARGNLGLGSAATHAATDFATDSLAAHLAGSEAFTGAKIFNAALRLGTQSLSTTATLSSGTAPVVLCDTTAAAFTVTLPATPTAGDLFIFCDVANQWGTHNLTIALNGKTLDGSSTNPVLGHTGGAFHIYYDGTGWHVLGAGPSDVNPAMDGSAAPGTSFFNSRRDHVHPTDTSRAPASGIAPSAVTGTAVTQADTNTVTSGMIVSITAAKVTGIAVTQADTGTVTVGMLTAAANERAFVLGKAGAIAPTETNAADFPFVVPFNCTIVRMKATLLNAATGAMIVQLRSAAGPITTAPTYSDISSVLVTFANTYVFAGATGFSTNLSEGDFLNFSCSTGSGSSLMVEVVVKLR